MPETPVTFIIDGEDISPSKFIHLLDEFLGVLTEVDRELSDVAQPTLEWQITSLSYNSPATVGLVCRPRRKLRDIGPLVVRTSLAGLQEIERDGNRPASFNDKALEHVREISRGTGDGVRQVEARSDLHASAPVTVTRQSAVIVDRVMPEGYSVGSIEGRLEGLDIHRQPRFTVYDAVTGRAVWCFFESDQIDTVKAAVGHKVIVSGNLRRDTEGRPQQMRRVDFFKVIDQPPPHPPHDAAGAFGVIDDPDTYLEKLRGG